GVVAEANADETVVQGGDVLAFRPGPRVLHRPRQPGAKRKWAEMTGFPGRRSIAIDSGFAHRVGPRLCHHIDGDVTLLLRLVGEHQRGPAELPLLLRRLFFDDLITPALDCCPDRIDGRGAVGQHAERLRESPLRHDAPRFFVNRTPLLSVGQRGRDRSGILSHVQRILTATCPAVPREMPILECGVTTPLWIWSAVA